MIPESKNTICTIGSMGRHFTAVPQHLTSAAMKLKKTKRVPSGTENTQKKAHLNNIQVLREVWIPYNYEYFNRSK